MTHNGISKRRILVPQGKRVPKMKLGEPVGRPNKNNFTEEYKRLINYSKEQKVDYKKLYEELMQEHKKLKQDLENNNQTLTGNSNIQISAGKDVNITISEGDKFSDSVNMEERK